MDQLHEPLDVATLAARCGRVSLSAVGLSFAVERCVPGHQDYHYADIHSVFALGSINVAHSHLQEKTMPSVKNIVLVHGAWADGSSWSKVVPLLQAKGLNVVCTQNPLTSIADDVAGANRLINAQDGPVLLAGHSYGGGIITVAGDNPKVKGLVYVAAFAPDEGETLGGLAQPFGPTPHAHCEGSLAYEAQLVCDSRE
jgi:pimeloyl-ACP methyl ester carboxylesterase